MCHRGVSIRGFRCYVFLLQVYHMYTFLYKGPKSIIVFLREKKREQHTLV